MRRALLLLCAAACATGRPALAPATRLSSIPVRSADGWVTLAELARGRPLVIELFATWCEPCREEIGRVDALARRPPGDAVIVAVDIAEEPATVERFVRRHGLALPVYRDPDLRFQESLGTDRVPQIVVIDRNGRIVHRGATLDAAARAAIEAAAAPTAISSAR